jgi:hypothetical protein
MCTNGVNTAQLGQMIDMIYDHIKVERRWVHNLGHALEDAGLTQCGTKLHETMAALDNVQMLLDESRELLEDDSHHEHATNSTVALV